VGVLAALLGSKLLEGMGKSGPALANPDTSMFAENVQSKSQQGVIAMGTSSSMASAASSGDTSPLTALSGHWPLVALALLALAAALGAWWWYQRRKRRPLPIVPLPPPPKGRVLLLLVGTYGIRVFTKMAIEMAKTGALAEIAIVALELDEKERIAFRQWLQRVAPDLPAEFIEDVDWSAGGIHATFDEMLAMWRDWGGPLEKVVGRMIDLLERLGWVIAEVWALDGIGSQSALAVVALWEYLYREHGHAKYYLQLIIPASDPQQSRFEAVLAKYEALPFVSAVLTTHNSLASDDNDQGLCAWCAWRFSSTAGAQGFNIMKDVPDRKS
jgi:hypothetical protein